MLFPSPLSTNVAAARSAGIIPFAEPISVAEATALLAEYAGDLQPNTYAGANPANDLLATGLGAGQAALEVGQPITLDGSNLVVYPNGAVVPADEPRVAAVKAGFKAAHILAKINGF